MAQKAWFGVAMLLTAISCGTQQKFSNAPGAQESPAPTTTKKASDNAKAAPKEQSKDASVDCDGVKVHAGHPLCDADDVKVANGDVEVPPPVVVDAPKPAAPAPAPLPAPAPTQPPKDPNIVEFHIKAGTGNQPWNAADTMVTVKVGQTLRIVNDDTVTHRLHTGGAPCPHGTNFGPGQSYDCVAKSALDPAATPGRTYDHIVGNSALFFLKAVP